MSIFSTGVFCFVFVLFLFCFLFFCFLDQFLESVDTIWEDVPEVEQLFDAKLGWRLASSNAQNTLVNTCNQQRLKVAPNRAD